MKIAVFTKNTTNPAYAAARLGAERVASRHGASVVHFVPQKPDDIDQQSALIDEALLSRPDAIVFVPVHMSALDDKFRQIEASGIPVVNFINRLVTGRALTFVGSDDEELARKIADYLAKHLNRRGRILLMEGVRGSVTSGDRMKGFRDALGAYPAIQVSGTLTGNYQQTVGREVMRDHLACHPSPFDAVLAANDAMALGAIEALEERGIQVPVTGVNAVPGAVSAIKRGALLASANFDALQIACIATEAAVRHLRGESLPAEILLPVQIVDRHNCAAWDRPLQERECPRWEDVVGR